PERSEDRVLETVVRKIETVQRELGSLGAVVFDEIDRTLVKGIDASTQPIIEALGADTKAETVAEEFEDGLDDLEALQEEVQRAGRRLERSQRVFGVDPDSLRGVVEVGLKMAEAGPLE